jgi:hypothetical protein
MHYIYKTINLQNGKYYIGKHIGKVDDDYLGSGIVLKQAIEKYGKESFQKEVLVICLTEEELDYWEKKIINLRIQDPNCYNIAPGGEGGYTTKYFSDSEKRRIRQKASAAIKKYRQENPEEVRRWQKAQRETLMKNIEQHKLTIRQSLSRRSETEVQSQHEKITKAKLANGHYSIFQLIDPSGKIVMESIGAEQIAKKHQTSANGIRLAAKHGNPIKRGNLQGYLVKKVTK